jgi:hypothetical protein
VTLLEYVVPRRGRKLGKRFSKTVILSPDDVFCVDEAWLSTDIAQTRSRQRLPELANGDFGRKGQIIEAALAESGGRVYGTNGAAAKFRIPPSTLDYKIKKLQISKDRFKLC